ncbi:MAG: NAD(P)-dependent oxidoreductase [Planctomycetota bacterium]|jgi:3-hydroxyisobutyrate dehydrogenase
MKRIGYIGTGIMGRAMAINLIKAGFGVTVWNRTRENAQEVIDAGAAWADSPALVAAVSEAVCINVTDTPDVEAVIFGDEGVSSAGENALKDLIVIDNSTISPQATRDFATRLGELGVAMLDAPVSGGDVGARAGTLSVMVGGASENFEKCMPIFEAVGKAITHVGESGAGQACKACNQVLCAVNLVAVCESMSLAVREGLDLKKMIAVTSAGAGGSWSLANLGPQIAKDDMAPGFMIDLINKDLNIVSGEANELGLPMPGAKLATELLRSAATLGHGRDGTQALSKVFERIGGFSYLNL